ncbi:MAG TPA: glycoside hydrolase family 2 TIM barrel-domain containing protein, partial [Planctomycetota bacterium]|nr:glycoside hydrolase family 2 TIM barrel-domain containing protein [Planctomycetota bacterium]
WSGRILVPFCIESAFFGVMQALKPEQKLWYHRIIDIPAAWSGQQIMLHCDAIDWESDVYLDGKAIDRHRGGYDRFSINLTQLVKAGASHHLVIAVTDPTDSSWNMRGKQTLHPGGASYTACSGIWQTVWLEPVPLAAVDSLHIVGDHTGRLTVTVDARTPPDPMPVTLHVLDGEKEVARADGVLGAELVGGIKENFTWYKVIRTWVTTTLNLTIPAVKAWSPSDPFLYDLVIELKDKSGTVVDRVTSHVGMRTVAVAKDELGNMRFHLNGRPLMLPGALDQGFWPDGVYTASTDAALKYDIEAAKQLGLVAIRKHFKVEPERYYSWADKLGLLVLQDLPSGGEGDPFTDEPRNHEAAAVCEMEKRRLIQQRWNHPSIIGWAMFNEGWGQYDTLRHAAWAKQLDPSRLIDEASGFPRHGGGDLHDVHGGNPPKEATRIGIDSETLGVGLKVSGHMWPGKLWGTGSYDPNTGGMKEGWDPTEMDDAAKRWHTRLCADFYRGMWAGMDDTGTSGDFKVQLYDLETEANGMLTYDRQVWKVDPAVVKRACSGVVTALTTTDLVPCSLTRQ